MLFLCEKRTKRTVFALYLGELDNYLYLCSQIET